jgi:carnitine-CoA ligase
MPRGRGVALDPAAFGVEQFSVPAVLDRRAAQYGDQVMMSIAGTPVTFAQMRDRSCAAAHMLSEIGVVRGETVALFTGTCPEWVYFWLGAARIGAVSAAVNGASKGDFLAHALNLSRAAVVIVDTERADRVAQVSGDVTTLRSTLEVDHSLTDTLTTASVAAPMPSPSGPTTSARCSSPPVRRDRRRPSPRPGTTCSPPRRPSRRPGSSNRETRCGPPCRCST